MQFYIWLVLAELVLLGLSVSLKRLGNKQYSLLIWSAIITLCIVGMFRFDVGWDYPAYYNSVLEYSSLEKRKFELFNYLLIGCAYYLNSPFIVFGLYAGLTYYFILTTLKQHSVDFKLAFLIFFFIFYIFSFGAIRQALALSITFWGWRYIKSQCFFRYLLVCIVAMLFHSSAIIALLVYPAYHWLNFKKIVIISILLFSGMQLLVYILEYIGLYAVYLNQVEDFSGGAFIRFYYVFFVLILFVLFKQRSRDIDTLRLFNIVCFGVAFPFIFGAHMGTRLGYFFLFYLMLLVPKVLSLYSWKIRLICIIGVAIYFLMLLFVSTRNLEKSPYTPYRFIWEVSNPVFK